jgi:hypothetical protein
MMCDIGSPLMRDSGPTWATLCLTFPRASGLREAGLALFCLVGCRAVLAVGRERLVGGKVQVKVSAGSARILMDVSGY